MEAWVTSAVDDKAVNKAIVLAGSLRRVRTAKKLVVVVSSSGVRKELREKLRLVFDLVHLLDDQCQNGLTLEEQAKIEAFALVIFNKCIYLSPNSLVLENCDDLFEKYSRFAAAPLGSSNSDDVDSSVYVYVPSLDFSRALAKAVSGAETGELPKYFNAWLKNQMPDIERLDEQYNVKLSLNVSSIGLNRKVSIVNFINAHPIENPSGGLHGKANEMNWIEKLSADLCQQIFTEDVNSNSLMDLSPHFSPNSQYKTEPVAIVGLSFRLPGGNSSEEFWNLLIEGRDAIIPVPPHRWTKKHSYIPCLNRKFEAGFLKDPVDEFDAKFFGLSPKEAEFLDPQQRLLHEVSWEAMEDAMIDPLKLKGSQTGVFVGSWIYDYKDICARGTDLDFFRIYLGNSIAASAARLSRFFEITGPSVATESGCSSAIAALDMACKSLRNGNCDFAIAGGVNLLLHPLDDLPEFIFSPDFRCRTFDANANGFGRAEGCAVFLLKRLSDAVKDKDQIWGLIRGSALTQEGVSKSLGTPTIHCESLAMELALKDAGVQPKEVSYIETHGTGTPVGDPMEVAAITKAYSKGRTDPVLIGSVKTNVGHTESVSGMTGIIKVLLSMKNEVIPKHLNLETLNPNINLDAIPAKIPLEPVPWPRCEERKRIAGVSSFGISGTNGHAIIEEPPILPNIGLELGQERPLHIMKISAKSNESMEELLQKYLQIFSEKVEAGNDSAKEFADSAYSANIGRATFNIRLTLIAQNVSQAAKILKEKSFKQVDVQSGTSRLCFLFTGQGSQYPNMGKQLYETSPIFKDSFDKCDEILQKRYHISIRNILWSGSGSSADELSRTLYSQTSIFVVEYCLLKLWESWGVKPDYVIGHSLGEFAAAVAAGALTFEDALMLVAERSRLIDSLPKGKMLVIKSDQKAVDDAIAQFKRSHENFWVDYAALNSPDQTVVAGDSSMIEEFSKFCDEKSLKTVILAATHAFHSRHMDPILEPYREIAATANRPKQGESQKGPLYISGLEGGLVDLDSVDADYWVRHTREKVRFMDACKTVEQQEGVTLFLEVGPHPVLSALVMGNVEGQSVTCLPSLRRKEEEWVTLLDSLSRLYLSDWKGEVGWAGFDQFYSRNRVKLPFYPFNRKSIWTKFEPMYPQIHPLLGRLCPTASSETVYETAMTLKSANFAQEHVIGNTVVFPGAGFLEMCVAGGHAAVQGHTEKLIKPKRPIALKSMKIASPLALYESGVCKIQTVVALSENQGQSVLGYSVGVYRHMDEYYEEGGGVSNWIQHSSATFLPAVPKLAKELTEPLDIGSIQSTCETLDIKEFYEKLPEVGLRFGPKFQSLQSGWKSETEFLASVKVPEDHNAYLIHPVVADAMIQAVMLWTLKGNLKKKLHVPIQIGEFIWISSSISSTTCFVHCTTGQSGTVSCTLLNESGEPLAYVTDIDFIETTVKLVEGMIHQQSTAMPNLWQEVWKSCPGPFQGSLDLQNPEIIAGFDQLINEEDRNFYEERNQAGEMGREFRSSAQNITRLSVLNALYVLGWKPTSEETFLIDDLVNRLGIKTKHSRQLRFFFRSIANNWKGSLKSLDAEESTFQICEQTTLPTLARVEQELATFFTGIYSSQIMSRMVKEISKCLHEIFVGKVDPLSIIFNQDPNKPNASTLYDNVNLGCQDSTSRLLQSVLDNHLRRAKDIYLKDANKASQCRPIYRVLEVGSGTATFTKRLIEVLDAAATDFDLEFYVTDISAAFFNQAEKTLEKYLKHVKFKKFDMEKDPLEQGYSPSYFDNIFAMQVLHVAKNLKRTLRNLRALLKPGGTIQILETVVPDEIGTFIFGLLDGYWQFKDLELRRNHTTLEVPKWHEVFLETGYEGVKDVPLLDNCHALIVARATLEDLKPLRNLFPVSHSWIILGGDEEHDAVTQKLLEQLESVNRKCFVVSKQKVKTFTEEVITDFLAPKLGDAQHEGNLRIEGIIYLWGLNPECQEQAKISLPFVSLMKLVLKMDYLPRTYVLTRGAMPLDDSEVVEPSAGTLVGLCRSLANENLSLSVNLFDLDPSVETVDQVDEVFANLWVDLKLNVVFREGLRMVTKLSVAKIPNNEPLSLPSGCDRFQLVLPKTKTISDLEFAYLEPYTLDENEVEVQVKAVSLNFRDVFVVFAPSAKFEEIKAVGVDYAGVVTRVGQSTSKFKVGQRVVGLNISPNLSFPSHVKAPELTLMPLPEDWTFAEGSQLPCVLTTAVYCLVNIAKVKRGDTVLIHTASGGMGLFVIQICKHLGATVIATAGSRRKRAYLRSLGIQHVFHSRTTDFGKKVLEVTNGRGVDIVLNSLTGPGFKEASLEALGERGKFIEMSKYKVWTAEEVNTLRPDVVYQIADIEDLEMDQYLEHVEEVAQYLTKGIIKPVPYQRFDTLHIRGALRCLQKAKHIGKIVCIMPEVRMEKSKLVTYTPLFNEESTYLVTGGLGGIGWEVVKWMLRNGAKHIAIASRSSPNAELASQMSDLNKAGKHVEAFSVDVGDFEKCKELLKRLNSPELGFPRLRGVMHAAGSLQDATLENQTWDKFFHTYNSKVNGTWNLHLLTKDLLLEHFVLFGSTSSILGPPGQTNHSASTSFQAALASYRRFSGLPATCVNWGNWGEVGVATEVDLPGIRPISTSQGLLALETFLKTQASHVTVLNVDSFQLFQQMFPTLKHYLADIRLLGSNKTTLVINSDEFWNEVDSAQDREGKVEVFKNTIKLVIRSILKMEQNEAIDDHADFQSIGIDSLMMLEMKNSIQNVLGERMTVSTNQLQGCNNLETLANKLVDILEGEDDSNANNLPSPEELKELIREDCNLIPETLTTEGKEQRPVNKVETVLLAGASGTIGPYLLKILTQERSIKKVYCLIRKGYKKSSEERLQERLQQIQILDSVDMSKVEVLNGDVTCPKLNLTEKVFDKLCLEVDAVINSAVRSDHAAKYRKAPETNKNHVRNVNVLGTLHLLQFCAEGRLKHYCHMSTMVTFTGTGENGEFSEGWQSIDAFNDLKYNAGYLLSKHISEQLVRQAILRGVPCKVFRLPLVAGDSKTGRFDYEKNHMVLRWLTSLKVGAIHDLPTPFTAIPVDHCAKITLDIFLNPDAPMDVFNVVQKTIVCEQVLLEVALHFGIRMEVVSYDKFSELIKAEAKNSALTAFVKIYDESHSEVLENFESPHFKALRKYIDDSTNFLDTSPLSKYVKGYENLLETTVQVVIRDFTYLKDEGVFDKFGIKASSVKAE